jgi:hypothetical protein
MMRRISLRDYFDRHPAIPLAVFGLLMIYEAIHNGQRLVHARATVQGNWTLTVTVGLASALALTGMVASGFWWASRRPGRATQLRGALALGSCGIFMAGMMYTGPASRAARNAPETITSAFRLGAIAFMIPLYAGVAVLMAWAYSRLAKIRKIRAARGLPGRPDIPRGDLLTGLIGPEKDGWSVMWVREGKAPRTLRAPTLTAVAELAAAAAARLWHDRVPSPTAELQLVIFPTRYDHGPILEIGGAPGAFAATDPQTRMTVRGATLEDLITAADTATGSATSQFMLRWARPIAALPPSIPSCGMSPQPRLDASP